MAGAYGALPLRFEANGGRTDREVKFLTRGAGYSMFFTPREAVLSLSAPAAGDAPARSAVVRMGLLGADPGARIVGGSRQPGVTNSIKGNDPSRWKTGIAGYSQLTYQNAYPGIDVVFHGKQRELEYDFVVAPQADPNRIGLSFAGAERLRIAPSGDLVIATPAGELRQRKPVSYQEVDGVRRPVESSYVLDGSEVRFRLGPYDRARPLVIDPVISYQTYLGGSGPDQGRGIAVDSDGHGYVTGSTASTDFPTKAGPAQPTPTQGSNRGGESDVFVTKLSPDGTRLIYSTYLGGGASAGFPTGSGLDAEEGEDVVADATGSAYVTGFTEAPNFPTSANAYKKTPTVSVGGDGEAFVVKLGPGGIVEYSTLLGAVQRFGARGITLAPSCTADCAAYVTGWADDGYPTTPGAYIPERAVNDVDTGFVTKLAPTGGSLVFSTYTDGRGLDIAVDPSGNVYVTGDIRGSFSRPAPIGYKLGRSAGDEPYLTKLNSTGTGALYSTYLGGGGGQEEGRAVSVDASGVAYVAGYTTSRDFPTTPDAFQTQNLEPRTQFKAFLSKLDTNVGGRESLLYSTFIGGSSDDQGTGMGLDAAGKVYIAGRTLSGDFPVKQSLQAGGAEDGFVVALDTTVPGADGLIYSTRLGGADDDEATGIAVSRAGDAYVVGQTSSELSWVNPFQKEPGAGSEIFVTKVGRPTGAPIVTDVAPRGGPPGGGTRVTITGTNFTGATAVSFGDTPASSTSVISDTELRATSPAHAAGQVLVRVTNATGTSPNAFTARYEYGPWRATGALGQARLNGHTATLLKDGKVLVAGGAGPDGQEMSAAELYDPATGTWTATDPMTRGRRNHTATLLGDGTVLVTGGVTPVVEGGRSNGNTAELYDPATGKWAATTAPMGFARHLHSATLITGTTETCRDFCGKVMVVGGRDSNIPTSTRSLIRTEVYNPATKSFEAQADTFASHSGQIATVLPPGTCTDCGKVLIVGSYGISAQGVTRDVEPEVFEPLTRTWRVTRAPTQARYTPSGLLLPSGRVLVAGGSRNNSGTARTAFREVESYDPATSLWSPLASLTVPRNRPAVAQFPDGKVLLAGGDTAAGRALASTELYNPAGSGSTAATGSMLLARGVRVSGGFPVGPTATLLPGDPAACDNCGRVLVIGGTAERVTEIYDPSPRSAPGPGADPPPSVPPGTPPPADPPPGDAPPTDGAAAGSSPAGTPAAGSSPAGTPAAGSTGAAPGAITSTTPSSGGLQSAGGTAPASTSLSELQRARSMRSCLAKARTATRPRRINGRVTPRAKRLARTRFLAARQRCVARHGRTPGRVTGLRVKARSATRVDLSFNAPGTNGSRPPAARDYVVKQSMRPITGSRGFSRAVSLCRGSCRFSVTEVGRRVSLTITDLRRGSIYYYAVAAKDNVSGRVGPRTRAVRVKTGR